MRIEVVKGLLVELERREDDVRARQDFAVKGIEIDPALLIDQPFGCVRFRMAEDIGGSNNGFLTGL